MKKTIKLYIAGVHNLNERLFFTSKNRKFLKFNRNTHTTEIELPIEFFRKHFRYNHSTGIYEHIAGTVYYRDIIKYCVLFLNSPCFNLESAEDITQINFKRGVYRDYNDFFVRLVEKNHWKITDYSIYTGDNEITDVQIFKYQNGEYSANFIIGDRFIIQRGTDGKYSIPKGSEQYWKAEENQNIMYDRLNGATDFDNLIKKLAIPKSLGGIKRKYPCEIY